MATFNRPFAWDFRIGIRIELRAVISGIKVISDIKIWTILVPVAGYMVYGGDERGVDEVQDSRSEASRNRGRSDDGARKGETSPSSRPISLSRIWLLSTNHQ